MQFKQALEAVVRSGGSCPKLAVLVHVLLQHFNVRSVHICTPIAVLLAARVTD